VLELEPEHVSAYALTLEHGTPFGRWAARGLLPLPDPDAAAEMYEWAGEMLEAAGYEQYEISNWGKKLSATSGQGSAARQTLKRGIGGVSVLTPSQPPPNERAGGPLAKNAYAHLGEKQEARLDDLGDPQGGKASAPDEAVMACRHNLQYWRALPYLGLGAGAHGYANGYRYSNVLRIKTYIERLAVPNGSSEPEAEWAGSAFPLSPAVVNQHRQMEQDDRSEFMMTGLRLTQEGVRAAEFHRRFGSEVRAVYERELADLERVGLIEFLQEKTSKGEASEVIRLTKRGRLLGNQVFMRFV
jgi:coproporphyrinogen III oxidase-like Fe-S oxidoreductase